MVTTNGEQSAGPMVNNSARTIISCSRFASLGANSRSRNCAAYSRYLLQGGDIVGKHSIPQRSWTCSVVMTGAVTAAAMCVALSAAGTAEAKTHHGPNAPGNPFSTPSAPLGVGPMQLSATTITRHSTTTTTQFGSARSSTGGGTGTSSGGLGPVSSFNIGTRSTAGPGTSTSGPAGRTFGPAARGSAPAGSATLPAPSESGPLSGLTGAASGAASESGPAAGAAGLAGIASEFSKAGHGGFGH
ncbi:MAG: hypothetical protein QOC62_5525 [Mycobacterium sp.]|jgi:hypothetical protein|nr:hypothetical protein [Mycobacterium sp.]